MEKNKLICKRIKDTRLKSGLTQIEFANRIYTHPFDYARVENGVECLSKSMLKLISYEFNVPFEWLCSDEDEQKIEITYNPISIKEIVEANLTDNDVSTFSDITYLKLECICDKLNKISCPEYTKKQLQEEMTNLFYITNQEGFDFGYKTGQDVLKGILLTKVK